MQKTSRQHKMIIGYLEFQDWASTVDIVRYFLNTRGYVMFDLRKRASELKKLGIIETRHKGKYAEYKLIRQDNLLDNNTSLNQTQHNELLNRSHAKEEGAIAHQESIFTN